MPFTFALSLRYLQSVVEYDGHFFADQEAFRAQMSHPTHPPRLIHTGLREELLHIPEFFEEYEEYAYDPDEYDLDDPPLKEFMLKIRFLN